MNNIKQVERAGILPLLKVHGQLYFADERLHQFRSAVRYPEIIQFIPFGKQFWHPDAIEWWCDHLRRDKDGMCIRKRCRKVFVDISNGPSFSWSNVSL